MLQTIDSSGPSRFIDWIGFQGVEGIMRRAPWDSLQIDHILGNTSKCKCDHYGGNAKWAWKHGKWEGKETINTFFFFLLCLEIAMKYASENRLSKRRNTIDF